MTEYQIEFNNMVYYGPNYLSHDFVNYGTYYAQLGHMLYTMNEGGASLSVSGEDVKPALATIINGVKSNIALLFGLNKKLIEIPRATPAARNGLSFEMYLFLNDSDSKESKYRALLNELVDDGRLGDIFKSEWSVSGTISVQNAKLEIVKSRAQQRQDNTSNTE
eukprot:295690_1